VDLHSLPGIDHLEVMAHYIIRILYLLNRMYLDSIDILF
jgi:hypothetical protein